MMACEDTQGSAPGEVPGGTSQFGGAASTLWLVGSCVQVPGCTNQGLTKVPVFWYFLLRVPIYSNRHFHRLISYHSVYKYNKLMPICSLIASYTATPPVGAGWKSIFGV